MSDWESIQEHIQACRHCDEKRVHRREMIVRTPDRLSPGKKAQHTPKWARTMTKWLVTYSHRTGARWNLVDFGGKTGVEARGVVDLVAIRKDHLENRTGLKRGDLLEIVLIQTKGGTAPPPTAEDLDRLSRVARHHRAKALYLRNGGAARSLICSGSKGASGNRSHRSLFLDKRR